MSLFNFLMPPQFGKLPSGERLKRIKQSPNYKDGAFQNKSFTPALTEGATYFSVSKEIFFGDKKNRVPIEKIPGIKTNLFQLEKDKDVLIWFGHSSYFMQIEGCKILVDPVFCGHASPFNFSIKSFGGTDVYQTEDIPEIDYLFLSHDHYDHLDYKTILKLKPKIKNIITGLGTGEHLEYWSYDRKIITEMDWNETIYLDNGFKVDTTPARHFSGRGFKRNQALWTSFVLKTPTLQIFIGGDSGFDTHFAEIGKTFGEFDLVILENGQYNRNWRHIHMLPDEILQVAKQLNAKRILPVHSSKFALANHAWNEPLELISKNNLTEKLNVITPMIGEEVNLKDTNQKFSKWWENVK